MRPIVIAAALAVAAPVAAVVGGGDIIFQVKGAKPVTFSHQLHVADATLGCRECHPALFLDTTRSKHVTMAQMKKGQSCGACHNGKRAGALDDCKTCHR